MLSRFSILPVALIALGGSQIAAAASNYDEGQWVTSFMAGSQLIPHETISPQIGGHIDGVETATLNRLQVNDAFRSGPTFSVEAGYMSESNLEPFVRLSYSRLEGRNTSIGSVAVPALDSATAIGANFDDMKSWGLNLGTRYFLSDTGTVRTYLAGYVGAQRTDALRADLGFNGSPASREELLPRATRFDADLEGGVSWKFADQADLDLSIGAQYVNARHKETDAFAPVGIDAVQFTDPRWSIPVNLGVNFRF